MYPSTAEIRSNPSLPKIEVNHFVDTVLHTVYAAGTQSRQQSRKIIFSSLSPTVCTALNWKQPNCTLNVGALVYLPVHLILSCTGAFADPDAVRRLRRRATHIQTQSFSLRTAVFPGPQVHTERSRLPNDRNRIRVAKVSAKRCGSQRATISWVSW